MVKLVELLDDPKFDSLYIIMELVKNGSLDKKLKKGPLPIEDCRKYFRELIAGLEYCKKLPYYSVGHDCAQVIHRDIKPENLLLTSDGHIKITDFGVGVLMEGGDDILVATAGSDCYLAPEVCKGQKYKGRQSDIWACGITLFYMVTGKLPFGGSSIPELYSKIQNDEYPLLAKH